MITASDIEYQATKRIKQGQAHLKPPFDELASWIADMWEVTVLNVIYDSTTVVNRPRLQIILEHRCESEKFRDGCNFDAAKEYAIKDQFFHLIANESAHHFSVDGLFVSFSAFAPIANAEADNRIRAQQIEALKNRLANPDLWEISRFSGYATFLFYTNAQAAKYERDGTKIAYSREYFKILKPYDEFGYLSVEDYTVGFDSKENFDTNYKASWFYYYR